MNVYFYIIIFIYYSGWEKIVLYKTKYIKYKNENFIIFSIKKITFTFISL